MPPVFHAVYVKGQNVVVKVRWRNWHSFAVWGTWTLQAAELAVPKPGRQSGTDSIALNVQGPLTRSIYLLANGGVQEETLVFTGCPSYVAVGLLNVKFNLPLTNGVSNGNNGTNGNYYGFERMCFLDASPVGLMLPVWADLAEYSCRWAYGSSGPAQVKKNMTLGMHYSLRCPTSTTYYSPNITSVWEGPEEPLYLSTYLLNMGNPWNAVGAYTLDCRAFAAVLMCSMHVHGVNAVTDRLQSFYGGFWHWPLCLAGMDSNNGFNYSDWISGLGGFNFHVMVRSGDTNSGLMYDAAASYKYGITGGFWRQPAWEWPVSQYWQNPVGTSFPGLAFHNTMKCLDPPSQSELVPLLAQRGWQAPWVQ